MNFGIPDKDQAKVKEAFSSLWEVCGNVLDNIVDNKKDEKIQELEKQIWNLEEEVQVLSKEREKENDKVYSILENNK